MRLASLPDGAKGFDVNKPVDAASAKLAASMKYQFAVRYIRRDPVNPKDITVGELAGLLEAGLGVMLAQHVASENIWRPTAQLGVRYGATAAEECQKVGLPRGGTVWLDLEGVAPGTTPGDVILYCNNWHDQVARAGYRPGLYVGWHAVLSAEQLYRNLRFDTYWMAYNANADQRPIVRGACMRQRVAKPADRFPIVAHEESFGVDVIRADDLGGTPTLLLPTPAIVV